MKKIRRKKIKENRKKRHHAAEENVRDAHTDKEKTVRLQREREMRDEREIK